ncbi:Acid protease [Mycena sanguinolenta]|uniref:Acid protease n=1 Tax=Mycena sanguinolenta TaxID=230812 RepID=A0A8H6XUJ7_9AGAR|nr:Acid protease [Mycena sanguinolenta]
MHLQLVHALFRACAVLSIVLSAHRSVAEPLHVPFRRFISRDYLDAARRTAARSDRTRNADVSSQNTRRDFFSFTSPFYVAEISIGTPPQKFALMVDTTISTTVVSAKGCTGCSSLGSSYDAAASSTSANKSTASINFPYLDGSVQGFISDDTITVGSLSVDKADFLQITDITAELPDPASGVLGLAFGGTGETTASPLWKTLVAANAASSSEMGFWLSSALTADNEQGGRGVSGSATLGSWTLEISAFNVGNKSIAITPNATLAMFDTTLDGIDGPEADVRTIYAAIPGSTEPEETIFQIPCNTTATISVSFGGQTWSIGAKDLVQEPVSSGSSECFGALGSVTGAQSPSWRFGLPFLQNVYTVFRENPASIGFAQLSTIAGGTGTPNATASTGGSSASAISSSHSSTSTSSNPGSTGGASTDTTVKTKSNTAAVAGGVSAGIIILLLLIAGVIFYRWRRRRQADPANYTVSAFHADVEAAPSGPSPSAATGAVTSMAMATSESTSPVTMSPVSSSAALVAMKRAQVEALNNHYGASNHLVQTPEGLHLSPATAVSSHSSPTSSSREASPGAGAGTTDPAILQELQTLRNEVRWLATQRTGDEPPPVYT